MSGSPADGGGEGAPAAPRKLKSINEEFPPAYEGSASAYSKQGTYDQDYQDEGSLVPRRPIEWNRKMEWELFYFMKMCETRRQVHEFEADRNAILGRWLKIPAVVLSASLSGTSGFAISTTKKFWPIVTAILNVILAIFTGVDALLLPFQEKERQRQSAQQYEQLKNDLSILLTMKPQDRGPPTRIFRQIKEAFESYEKGSAFRYHRYVSKYPILATTYPPDPEDIPEPDMDMVPRNRRGLLTVRNLFHQDDEDSSQATARAGIFNYDEPPAATVVGGVGGKAEV